MKLDWFYIFCQYRAWQVWGRLLLEWCKCELLLGDLNLLPWVYHQSTVSWQIIRACLLNKSAPEKLSRPGTPALSRGRLPSPGFPSPRFWRHCSIYTTNSTNFSMLLAKCNCKLQLCTSGWLDLASPSSGCPPHLRGQVPLPSKTTLRKPSFSFLWVAFLIQIQFHWF